MSLTPEEIAGKEFLVGLRGYDKDEVRAFLRTVSEAFAASAAPPPPVIEAEPAPEALAPAPATPATATGIDWSNLGEEIAAVLRTAHEQAAALRSEAASEVKTLRQQADENAATTRAQADAHADDTRATAEQERLEATSKLTSAQDEALALVADAQARVDKMLETSKVRAKKEAEASVAHLAGQIADLTSTRDVARSSLAELRTKLDDAIASPETGPAAPSAPALDAAAPCRARPRAASASSEPGHPVGTARRPQTGWTAARPS